MWPVAAVLLLGGLRMGVEMGAGRKKPPQSPLSGRATSGRRIVTFWKDVTPEEGTALVASLGGENLRPLKLINGVVCEFPRATQEFFQALALSPQIMDVEEDTVMRILCWWRRPADTPAEQVMPWGVKRIGAPEAWGRNRGKGVKVAVIDTGVNLRHPDLEGAVAGGVNLFDEQAPPMDDNGHGTHVAGIIAARDNKIGVVGVAPEAELYVLKAFDSQGSGRVSYIISGLEWCVQNGVKLVNMSFGGTENRALGRAVQAALDAGLLLVAAAGNDGSGNSVNFPASYPGVMAVSASTADDELASFSSWGPQVDIMAPGAKILSTYQRGYKELSGTSMATPHVTGAAALVWAAEPRLSATRVSDRLKQTAKKVPNLEPEKQGAGLLDVAAALGVGA